MPDRMCQRCTTILEPRQGMGGYNQRYCSDCRIEVNRERQASRLLGRRERHKERYANDPEFGDRARTQARVGRLMGLYGLTLEEYDRLYAQHACAHCGKPQCAVCKRHEDEASLAKLVVDHDHQTGVVRGLLCRLCNQALGMVEDSTSRLKAMIAYLERPPARVRQEGLPEEPLVDDYGNRIYLQEEPA